MGYYIKRDGVWLEVFKASGYRGWQCWERRPSRMSLDVRSPVADGDLAPTPTAPTSGVMPYSGGPSQ